MRTTWSRRKFGGSAAALITAAAARPTWALPNNGRSGMKIGYASMTWGNAERQAIDDISALRYVGIQLRNNVVTEFKPAELRDLLASHKLTFVALSSGELNIDPAAETDQLASHVANAKYVAAAGGLYLQVLDALKPYPRAVTPEECKRLGTLLTALGKRVNDVGVKLGYHNHMNTIGQRPDDVRRVMDASDPRCVGLELDTAHWVAGGGDPAKAVQEYRDRLLFMHLKDVVDAPLEGKAKYPFKFVELGKGRVDLPAVFGAIRQIGFNGWGIVELDRVPDRSLTPKQCAATSKIYLENELHARV